MAETTPKQFYTCPKCGKQELQRAGYIMRKGGMVARLQCMTCGYKGTAALFAPKADD